MNLSKQNKKEVDNIIMYLFHTNLDVIRDLALIIKDYDNAIKQIKEIINKPFKEEPELIEAYDEGNIIHVYSERFDKINLIINKILGDENDI